MSKIEITTRRVIVAAAKLVREAKETKKTVNNTKLQRYLSILEECVSDVIEIEQKIPGIMDRLKNDKFEIRYIKQNSETPEYPGLRYLFESGDKPSRLYRIIPGINYDKDYDICYLNAKKQVVRVVGHYLYEREKLLFYPNKNERVVIEFEKREKGVQYIYYSKSFFDDKNSSMTVIEIEDSIGISAKKMKYALKKKKVGYSTIYIDTYYFHDSKLTECHFDHCSSKSITAMLFLRNPYKLLWEVSENAVEIHRDDNNCPVSYTSSWVQYDACSIDDCEEHKITKEQTNKIASLEKRLFNQ